MSVSIQRHDCIPDFLGVYIDLNVDGNFTASELVGSVSPAILSAAPCGVFAGLPIVTFTFNISIPMGVFAPSGSRMRVIYTESGNAAIPCFNFLGTTGFGPFFGGEVEDYNVHLSAGNAISLPVANFTVPVNVCKNQTITLNDNSTNTPTAWSWTLTGASPATSTLQNPAVTYTTPGTYTISLESSNASGVSAIVSNTIVINNCAPVANFTVPVNVCKNQTITLNDNSTNTPTAWSWTLTGASPATSTLQNPAITYTNAGTYTISLVSTNASGASAIVSKTIAIIDCSPVANFTLPVNVCKNQTITLNDNSTNTPTAWSWTLTGASPATSTLQNPAVTYTNAGTYTISLKSTNAGGASAIVSKTIAINACNVGVNEIEGSDAKNITVYPNPTNGAFTIDLKAVSQVSIYNLLGDKIIAKNLEPGKHTIDIAEQANGVYFLRINTENKHQHIKIIKE
jgi:PKD repeat protein